MKVVEYYNWLKKDWAKVGLMLSIYLFVFLLVFVKDNDFILFLILLQTPLYMLHQTEEYVFPGKFEVFFNRRIFKVNSDVEPLNENFIFFVNIIYIWFLLPIFGLLSKYNYNIGLWIPYFSFFAGVAHIVLSIKAKKMYNPGLIVSLVLNIPVSLWSIFYFYENKILDSLFMNYHCIIGLVGNLVLPVMGVILYKQYKKNN